MSFDSHPIGRRVRVQLNLLVESVEQRRVVLEPALVQAMDGLDVLLRHRPPSIRLRRLPGLPPGDGRQSLVACPLLDVALELCRRRRCCASRMPNDPYDLARAPAHTAGRRRPVGGGLSLAARAAAVTDHVRDSWYGACHLHGSCPSMEQPTPAWPRDSRSLRVFDA